MSSSVLGRLRTKQAQVKYLIKQRDARDARANLADFVRQAWHVVEPGVDLVWSWHIDAICQHLEAVSDGRVKRLLVNVPPGHMKSLIVAVFWPAWVWIERPSWRALFGSYDMGLSTRDAMRCRMVVESDWYRDTFNVSWTLRGDQNTKTWFENTQNGLRMALTTSMTGKGTGFRGDATIFDDPLNVKQSPTTEELEGNKFWWDKRMSSRLNNMAEGVRVGIMQRLHDNDLSGHLIERGGYEHLCLPTEFDPERACKTSIGFEDPRTEAGELLFPQMFPPEVIAEAKIDLGSFQFAGQHNQSPIPHGGGILKAKDFRFWYTRRNPPPPVRVTLEDGEIWECIQERLPDRFDRRLTSTDCTFKDKKTSDFVVMQVWGVLKAKRFLLDQVHDRLSFTATLAKLQDLIEEHKGCNAHLIEDKANGTAVLNVLKDAVAGMIAIEPDGNKAARCEAISPQVEAGNLYLPHPTEFPWVDGLIHELISFPKSKHDDRMDALTQALNWLRSKITARTRLEWLTKM